MSIGNESGTISTMNRWRSYSNTQPGCRGIRARSVRQSANWWKKLATRGLLEKKPRWGRQKEWGKRRLERGHSMWSITAHATMVACMSLHRGGSPSIRFIVYDLKGH